MTVARWHWWQDGGRALAAGVMAAALYVAFGQHVLYGDAHEFLLLLEQGAVGHKNHLGYLPLLRLAADALAPFGWTAFLAARLCSQLGAALGVALLYCASRVFGLDRRASAWIAVLVATCPSVLFFATVVEVHAPYFACVGLAWLAAARLAARPTPGRGFAFGAATAFAYFGHASGLILPGPLLLVVLHRYEGPRAPLLRAAAVAVAVHVAVTLGVPWWLRGEGHVADPAGAWRFLAWWQTELDPRQVLLVLWDEWLLAYAPLSLLWLRAFAVDRRPGLVALAILLPYLVLSILFLARYREFGAYQQAVVWMFAFLTVRAWRTRVLGSAVIIALAVGVWRVTSNDDAARVTGYATGLAEVARGARPLLLIAGFDDLEARYVALPDTAVEVLADARYTDPARVGDSLRALDARIVAHRAAGGRVFVTAGAIGWIGQPAAHAAFPGLARLFEHLAGDYRQEFAGASKFVSYELLPK